MLNLNACRIAINEQKSPLGDLGTQPKASSSTPEEAELGAEKGKFAAHTELVEEGGKSRGRKLILTLLCPMFELSIATDPSASSSVAFHFQIGTLGTVG